MNKVLKLQRVGLVTPTVVEYEGKVLAINHLDVESTCNLWRVHFGFYPTEKVDLVMTKKQFLSIQQKTLSSVKSVYELFYERNFIPREFEANEEPAEWGMYRNKEIEELKAENTALRERLEKAVELPRVECIITKEWVNREMVGDRMFEWCVLHKKDGYLMVEPCLSKEAAEARLKEPQGGEE